MSICLKPLGHSQVTASNQVIGDTNTSDGSGRAIKGFRVAQSHQLLAWSICPTCKAYRKDCGHYYDHKDNKPTPRLEVVSKNLCAQAMLEIEVEK